MNIYIKYRVVYSICYMEITFNGNMTNTVSCMNDKYEKSFSC